MAALRQTPKSSSPNFAKDAYFNVALVTNTPLPCSHRALVTRSAFTFEKIYGRHSPEYVSQKTRGVSRMYLKIIFFKGNVLKTALPRRPTLRKSG